MYGCGNGGKGCQGWFLWGSKKTLLLPQAILPGLGGHQQIIIFKCELNGGKRWTHGNTLDICIGGVQLEKMGISY